MSPEPSSGHDIQATNVQALVAAQAQAQAMPPPVFHEFFNVLPPQLQNISPPIDPALLSNTPSGASPSPEFKHPKFKSKRGTNIQPKPKSLVYLILPSSCFEDQREVPALPQGYMPVLEDNEEPELIHRAPESDELDWNYLNNTSSHTNPGTPVTSSQPNSPKSSSSIEPPLKKRRGHPKKTFTTMDIIPQPQANVPDCESLESNIDETQLMEARPDTIHISSTHNHYGTRTNRKSSTKVIEELAYKHQETSAKNRIEALRNGKVKLQNKKVSGWSQRT
ncbi:hypothetical protein BGX38DRAFT_1279075 [Terfezia claveryi]|nr:hypothetical protein BGX38DRAFT_1279075 [Terfezia claveryi]